MKYNIDDVSQSNLTRNIQSERGRKDKLFIHAFAAEEAEQKQV